MGLIVTLVIGGVVGWLASLVYVPTQDERVAPSEEGQRRRCYCAEAICEEIQVIA